MLPGPVGRLLSLALSLPGSRAGGGEALASAPLCVKLGVSLERLKGIPDYLGLGHW